jgi:hypothetical protein
MNSSVPMPIWALLFLMGGLFVLFVLDGWRARMWTKFAKQMGFPVPRDEAPCRQPGYGAASSSPTDRERVDWLLKTLDPVTRATAEDWYISFSDTRQSPPCIVVAHGATQLAALDAAIRGEVRKCGE